MKLTSNSYSEVCRKTVMFIRGLNTRFVAWQSRKKNEATTAKKREHIEFLTQTYDWNVKQSYFSDAFCQLFLMSIQLQWRLIKRFQVEMDTGIKDIKLKITRTFDRQAWFVFAQFPICQQCQTLQKASICFDPTFIYI